MSRSLTTAGVEVRSSSRTSTSTRNPRPTPGHPHSTRKSRFDGADAYFQDSNIVWLEHDESIVLNRYLYFVYLNTRWTTDGGTIKRLYNNRILQQQICVPPIETQIAIADLLDRFDALVNDISLGLPAEIAARRAQYEHYRDRLLSFPEKVVSRSNAS